MQQVLSSSTWITSRRVTQQPELQESRSKPWQGLTNDFKADEFSRPGANCGSLTEKAPEKSSEMASS